MTTTVLIGTQGNKAVKIVTPNGEITLEPGKWTTLGIHGEQSVSVQEVGDFVDEPKGGDSMLKKPGGGGPGNEDK